MTTDQLITLISHDRSVAWSLRSAFFTAVGASIVLAAALFFVRIGFRPDIAQALATPRFDFKFLVTIVLTVTAIAVSRKIATPDRSFRAVGKLLLVAPVLLAFAAVVELVIVPSDHWINNLVGHNSSVCLTVIPLLSIAPLVCLLAALRHGAPANPGVAGWVAGLAASGIAATFYAANCTDDSPLFVATWYPIAAVLVSAVGYLVGRSVLRW